MVLARPSLYVGTIECYLKGNTGHDDPPHHMYAVLA